MKIIKYICFLFVSMTLFMANSCAKDIYYTNDNNVSFTKEEYQFISNFYYNGYQRIMTIDEFNQVFEDSQIVNRKIIVNQDIVPYDYSHSTTSKNIKIKKVDLDNKTNVTIVVNWYTIPKTKSYDVIGARLDGVILSANPITRIDWLNGSSTSNQISYKDLGFGVSIKVPENPENLIITQSFSVTRSGTIYASYQHAQKSISLNNSKKYNIAADGYGRVFKFDSSVSSIYDRMQGVDISI